MTCDYALTGLPVGTVCPECGSVEEPSLVALHGWHANGPTGSPMGDALVTVLFSAVLISIVTFVNQKAVLFVLFGLLITGTIASSTLNRLFRRGRRCTMKLVLSPAGFRQQLLGTTQKVKSVGRKRLEIAAAMVIGCVVVAAMVAFVPRSSIAAGAVMSMLMILFWTVRSSHHLQESTGSQPLVPWMRANRVQIKANSWWRLTDELRIQINLATRISRRELVVNFRCAPTRPQADQLIEWLRDWYGFVEADLGRFVPRVEPPASLDPAFSHASRQNAGTSDTRTVSD